MSSFTVKCLNHPVDKDPAFTSETQALEYAYNHQKNVPGPHDIHIQELLNVNGFISVIREYKYRKRD